MWIPLCSFAQGPPYKPSTAAAAATTTTATAAAAAATATTTAAASAPCIMAGGHEHSVITRCLHL